MHNRPDLVIFDCDGVLVDTEIMGNRHLVKLLNEAGHPITLEVVSPERLDERSTTITVAGDAAPVDQSGSANASTSRAVAPARNQILIGRNPRCRPNR